MKNNKKGFTLIELLVVIAIIGLLSTLAVVALNNARQKSRDAKRVADVKQVQTAMELYFNDQGGYPQRDDGILGQGNWDCLDSSADGFNAAGGCAGTVYMAQVPSNPTPLDGGTAGYNYQVAAAFGEYSIEYFLGANTGGLTAGLNTACSGGIGGCTAQ